MLIKDKKGVRKMTRNIMREAHKMTKQIVSEYGNVDYKTQLGLCLSFLSQEGGKEMVELKGTEKQIKWAGDLRSRFIKYLDFVKDLADGIEISESLQDDIEDDFDSLEEAFEVIEKQEKASKIIGALKGYTMFSSDEAIEKEIEKTESHLVDYEQHYNDIQNEKESYIAWTIMRLADMK